jgi:hypothetical protein
MRVQCVLSVCAMVAALASGGGIRTALTHEMGLQATAVATATAGAPPTVASCATQFSQQDCTSFDSACAWLTIQQQTHLFGQCYGYDLREMQDHMFETACKDYGKHLSSSDPTCPNVEMHDQAGVHVCKYDAQLGCTCGADRQWPPQHGCTW